MIAFPLFRRRLQQEHARRMSATPIRQIMQVIPTMSTVVDPCWWQLIGSPVLASLHIAVEFVGNPGSPSTAAARSIGENSNRRRDEPAQEQNRFHICYFAQEMCPYQTRISPGQTLSKARPSSKLLGNEKSKSREGTNVQCELCSRGELMQTLNMFLAAPRDDPRHRCGGRISRGNFSGHDLSACRLIIKHDLQYCSNECWISEVMFWEQLCGSNF